MTMKPLTVTAFVLWALAPLSGCAHQAAAVAPDPNHDEACEHTTHDVPGGCTNGRQLWNRQTAFSNSHNPAQGR
jgi:hypothetical protein